MSAWKRFLERIPLKAPWKITGAASSPENITALPPATAYRVRAPGTPGEKAFVPTSSPEHIYDIKYFTRDTKREVLPRKVELLDLKTLQERNIAMTGTPPKAGPGKSWSIHDSEDVPNGGYT